MSIFVEKVRVKPSWELLGLKVTRALRSLDKDQLEEFLHGGMVFDERFEVVRMNPEIDKGIRKKVANIFNPSGSLSPSVILILREKTQQMGMEGMVKIDRRSDLPLL